MTDSTRSERVRPLEPDAWDERTRRLLGDTLDRVAELEDREVASSRPLNLLSTIAHHPRLLEPFLAFAATLALGGVLSRRDSELLALRAAWNCRSAFEWGHHVLYARAAGLDDAEIGATAKELAEGDWSERDRVLLRTADELHLGQDVSDATWAALSEHFEDPQLVEIPFIVGNYTMLSMVVNATRVPLEPNLPKLP